MWASKLCFPCKYFIQTAKTVKYTSSFPKIFSSLSNKNFKLIDQYNAFPNSKFKKLNFNWPIRKQVTVPLYKKAVSANIKKVGIWMICCTGMVYVGITLGGYTRLTESGLSMVTWRFTYETFPSSADEWEAEFKKYQEFPEYKLLKKDITLENFKKIWYNEYIHRNWGRAIGLLFVVPASLFWIKGYFLPKMKKRILAFGLLIAIQGLLGWYMVKSGLEDRFHKDTDVPRVSQYRLAAHLGLALILYSGFLMTALQLLAPAEVILLNQLKAKNLKTLAYCCKGMVFLTAISGALVAGLDAGLVYNSFPKMGDQWVPSDILSLIPFYKNFTENPTTVQFDHRVLAISTFSLIMATWLLTKKYSLPWRAKKAATFLALVASLQVILGISTLLHYVPVSQAVAHQSGSVLLLSTAIWLAHELKKLRYVPRI